MYQVRIYKNSNDTEGVVIHDFASGGQKLSSGVIKDAINAIDSFDILVHPQNAGYGKLKPFTTLIDVYNFKTGRMEFEGRVLQKTENMDKSGEHSISYLCEGELGYLHDAPQRHLEFKGTPKELFVTILEYFNSQVEDYKRFEPGVMDVTNSTNNMYVYLSAEQTTFEAIKDKLLDRIGGELQIRKENGVRYLDYLQRIGEDKTTEIRLSKNMLSLSRDVDAKDIITRITPLGNRIASEDSSATDASEARLTIESVNSGVAYIDRPDLIKEFGIKGKSVTWDDVTVPENLKAKGIEYINSQKVTLNQYKVDAVDLSLIGKDIDDFRTGNGYPTINPIMGINEVLRVIGTTKDINAPQEGSLTIGDKFKNLYEYQADSRASLKAISDMKDTIQRLSNSNHDLKQSLAIAKTELQTIQDSLLNVDLDNLPAELQGISEQLIGIQSILDNLVIPEYGMATSTEAGLMSPDDKKKADLLTISKLIDLDDLANRVEALENPPEPPEEEGGI